MIINTIPILIHLLAEYVYLQLFIVICYETITQNADFFRCKGIPRDNQQIQKLPIKRALFANRLKDISCIFQGNDTADLFHRFNNDSMTQVTILVQRIIQASLRRSTQLHFQNEKVQRIGCSR